MGAMTEAGVYVRPQVTRTIHSPALRRAQRLHAQAVVVIGVAGILLGSGLLIWGPRPNAIDAAIFTGMFFFVGIGSTTGFHRHFTHCAFKATTPVRVALGILGSMAAQGTLIFWVTLHRRHHECSDAAGDPHSPHVDDLGRHHESRLRGLWHSYIGWTFIHEVPNAAYYARDLIRDPAISWVSRHYFLWVGLSLATPTALGAALHGSLVGALCGLVWGGLLRIFLWHNMIWSITSIAHLVGSRQFKSNDRSTNNVFLALPTLGESFHNNHHAFPRSAIMGLRWWQIDIGGAVILLLEALGLAWEVSRPTQAMMERKREDVSERRFSFGGGG
jgi:stearoyl-CoA desaturase (Delta-9 desaturase)